MISRNPEYSVLLLYVGIVATPAFAKAQEPLPTALHLARILNIPPGYEDWAGRGVARLLAYYYGGALGEPVTALLVEPTSRANVHIQRTALAVGAYPRSGISAATLLPFAAGERQTPEPLKGLLRNTALQSLAGRPDSSALPFWRDLERHPDVMLSQWAVSAYACILGRASIPDLERIQAKGPKHLPGIASRMLEHLRQGMDSAKVCLGGEATREAARLYPSVVSDKDVEFIKRFIEERRP